MDLFTIIVVIVGLSIFLVPVILDRLSKKKKSKGIEKQFFNSAKSKNIKITNYDIWRDSYAIGLDREARKLFYLDSPKNKEIVINLAEVKKCRISKKSQSADKTNNTSQVNLVFSFLKSDKPEQKLAFYRKGQDQHLQNEVDLAEKWLGIINLKLS